MMSARFFPVDTFLVGSIQVLNLHVPTKIVPSPIDKGFDSFPDSGHQQGMYAQPRCKGDRAVKFMSLLADRRYSRVAPDHCHYSLIVIVKRSSSLTRNLSQDVFCSPFTALLRNRTKLR